MTQARRVLLLASGQRIRAAYAEWVRRSTGCTHVTVIHGAQANRRAWPEHPEVIAYVASASGHGLSDRLRAQYPGRPVIPLSHRKAEAANTLRTFQFVPVSFNGVAHHAAQPAPSPEVKDVAKPEVSPEVKPAVTPSFSLAERRERLVQSIVGTIGRQGMPASKRQFHSAFGDALRRVERALLVVPGTREVLRGVADEIVGRVGRPYDRTTRVRYGSVFANVLLAWFGRPKAAPEQGTSRSEAKQMSTPKPGKSPRFSASGLPLVVELKRRLDESDSKLRLGCADLAWLRQQDELRGLRRLSWEQCSVAAGRRGRNKRGVPDNLLLEIAYTLPVDGDSETPAVAAKFVLVAKLAAFIHQHQVNPAALQAWLWRYAHNGGWGTERRVFLTEHLLGVGGEAFALNVGRCGTKVLTPLAMSVKLREVVEEVFGPGGVAVKPLVGGVVPVSPVPVLVPAVAPPPVPSPWPVSPSPFPVGEAWEAFTAALAVLKRTMEPAGVRACRVHDGGVAEVEVVTVRTLRVKC